jgi:alkylation response protein AidB-like acyl-CoA dehydrogenase
MDISLTEEQVMLRDALTRFLREEYDFEKRRVRLAKGGHDSRLWQDFATTLGILGASLPEAHGGLGGGAVETMIIQEALGAALVVEPYLETVVIGGGALQRSGGATAGSLLAGITDGSVRIALAAAEAGARYALANVSTQANRVGGEWRINGSKSVVIGAPVATHWLLLARTSGERRDREGLSLFLIDPAAAGIERHDYRLIDERPASDLVLTDVVLRADALLGEEGGALPILEQVMDEAIAGLCAEAVGVMRRMLEDTVGYARQRRQFGKPLASFQVLQHRMVDMFMQVEEAAAAALLATLRLDGDPVTRGMAASAAKATIARAARFVGQNAIQLHGAMGLTEELAVGHYFKRATAIENQLGSLDHHVARYAALSRQRSGSNA